MMHSIVKYTGILAGCVAIVFVVAVLSLHDDALPAFLSRGGNAVIKAGVEAPEHQNMNDVSISLRDPRSPSSTPKQATSSEIKSALENDAKIDSKNDTKSDSHSDSKPIASTSVAKNKASITSTKPASQVKPKTVSVPGPLYVEKPKPIPQPILATTSSSTIKVSTTTTSTSDTVTPNASGALNENDILLIVNTERKAQGLGPLTYNKKLAAMALTKAKDMIAKQYFAHVAPDGTDVVMLAERQAYDYLNIGENLAMGDFVSSQDVMTGWMNSPGHRANILNKNYTELGISAIEGNYQGRIVWYAVQEFGRPASTCTKPDVLLEQKIVADESQITTLQATLDAKLTQMKDPNMDRNTYNAMVADYNNTVNVYNTLAASIKAEVIAFNALVNQFNACLGLVH